MIFYKNHLKFILFTLILPVFWSPVHATPKRSNTDTTDTTATPPKRLRGAFWGSDSDSSASPSPEFIPVTSPQAPVIFSPGNSLAEIDLARNRALASDMGSLGISRPATPNDGVTLQSIKKQLLNLLENLPFASKSDWDTFIDSVEELHNLSTLRTLVDQQIIGLCRYGKLHPFVQRLIAHASQTPLAPGSGYAFHAELSQKLSHPYLAVLSLVHKINSCLVLKLRMQELELPIINCSHIFTPNSESGYHYEDLSLNRTVRVKATNPDTLVYGGTWRKRNSMAKFSNFFPQSMTKDDVCQSIREAFENQVAESLEINGGAKRVILGRSSDGIYIEMPTYFGVSVNAYPIFSYTKLPQAPQAAWSAPIGSKTYSYVDLLKIIKDAVFNHFNEAIRYTSFTQGLRKYAIVDIAQSEKLQLDGIKYGVYVQIPKSMLFSIEELREKFLITQLSHRRTPLQHTQSN